MFTVNKYKDGRCWHFTEMFTYSRIYIYVSFLHHSTLPNNVPSFCFSTGRLSRCFFLLDQPQRSYSFFASRSPLLQLLVPSLACPVFTGNLSSGKAYPIQSHFSFFGDQGPPPVSALGPELPSQECQCLDGLGTW